MLPPGSRRSKIRPPRKSLVSSSVGNPSGDSAVDYELSWWVLSNAITQIQNKNVSKLSYEQLYRKAYTLVLRKYGTKLYDDVASLIKEHLLRKRDGLLAILKSSSSLNNSINEEFMKAILLEWDEHLQSMKFVSDVLMYLNRVHVKEHKKLLIYDLGIQLFKENIIKHDDNYLGSKLIDIVIEEIAKNRIGEVITTKMYITKIINMLELLIETSNSGNDLQYGENYYQRFFEPAFLSNSETFFYNLSQEFMNNLVGTKYLNDIFHFIKEEENRINFYLPSSTYPKIIDLMNNILIKDKIDKILCLPMEQQGLSYWLQPVVTNIMNVDMTINKTKHYTTELKMLYELVGRIDPDYGLLKVRLKDLVISQGTTLPSLIKDSLALKTEGANSSSKKTNTNSTFFASAWINSVLEYQNQFSVIIKESFSGDAVLEQSITIGMREFINSPQSPSSGKKTGATLGSSAAELLSIYMDYQIKLLSRAPGSSSKNIANDNAIDMNGSSVDQTDDLINKSIAFLRFIKDKDAFEAHYANHFAKRFLNFKGSAQTGNSRNNDKLGTDLEELIISKLGEEMGSASLDKVIKMNKDIKLSRDLTKDWRSHVNEIQKDLIELDLKVCNVSDWPKSMTKDYKRFCRDDTNNEINFIWSRQLRPTIKEFEEYWFAGKRNDNKSLFWCPKFGSMDLRITYPSKTYDINMSTYSGVIMLLFAPQSSHSDGREVLAFEEMRELTYDEIRELTGIPESDLKRQLQSIAVAPRLRLLVKTPMTKEVNNSDVFKLNDKFKSPSTKVKVLTVSVSSSASSVQGKPANSSTKSVQQEEFDEVQASILEGRKLEVNAAIVRIMKSRRTINHNDLIAELIKQLHNRFQTLNILIKQRIEDLIEKEYLKRHDNDKSLYHYIA